MNLPVQFEHILTAGDFAFVGIPKDCDLLTVHVPTGATFAHATNGRTIFEFKGVCGGVLNSALEDSEESGTAEWIVTDFERIYGDQFPENVLMNENQEIPLDPAGLTGVSYSGKMEEVERWLRKEEARRSSPDLGAEDDSCDGDRTPPSEGPAPLGGGSSAGCGESRKNSRSPLSPACGGRTSGSGGQESGGGFPLSPSSVSDKENLGDQSGGSDDSGEVVAGNHGGPVFSDESRWRRWWRRFPARPYHATRGTVTWARIGFSDGSVPVHMVSESKWGEVDTFHRGHLQPGGR